MDKYRVKFSGCQVFQTTNPFHLIRRVYGPTTKICLVKLPSTTLLCEEVYAEYCFLVNRPIFDLSPKPFYFRPPVLEIVDGCNKNDWISKVCEIIRKNPAETLIVLEGIFFEGDRQVHQERIDSILAALH